METTPRVMNRFTRINRNLDRETRPGGDLRSRKAREARARANVALLSVDECVVQSSAFKSLADLVASTLDHGYVPTLRDGTPPGGTALWQLERAYKAGVVADAYDAEMSRLGRRERAFRG